MKGSLPGQNAAVGTYAFYIMCLLGMTSHSCKDTRGPRTVQNMRSMRACVCVFLQIHSKHPSKIIYDKSDTMMIITMVGIKYHYHGWYQGV